MYFWAGIWKYYCHVSNQRPQIFHVAKFGAKIKIFKFRTKNALFGYLWAAIWKKLLPYYFKSTPSNFPSCKFGKKIKTSKFGTKNLWFRYFWARIWKNYCHIWKQHLQISVVAKLCEETKMLKFGTKSTLFGYFWARI